MTFDPTDFGFVRLVDFKIAGQLDTYEYRNHAQVNGIVDVLRLNIYLCRDGDYVTIWTGLVEPMFAEGKFNLSAMPDFDFHGTYNEGLFRGYIESADEATVVLRTLRLGDKSRSLPQQLCGAPDDLRCEAL